MSGYLLNGQWRTGWYETAKHAGEFVRPATAFRNWMTADGASGFKAEPGRYHLYVSLACPWAHRTLIFRKLKRLEDLISVSVVDPVMAERLGVWRWPRMHSGHRNGFRYLHQVYTAADPDYRAA